MATPVTLLALASERLAYLGQAQAVFANNIANLDTPGFKPQGVLPFPAFLAGDAGTLAMTADNPADLPGAATALAVAVPADGTAPGPQSPDGNAVDMDQQLELMSQADLQSQFAGNLYRTYLGLYKTALGSG
jgi:flagellar basal-body rod protein FlgB